MLRIVEPEPGFSSRSPGQAASGVIADLMNESKDDPLSYFGPPTVVESMDDPLLYFRPESDATVVEFADDGEHVSGDTAEQKRLLVAQVGSEGSTIEPIALEVPREELKETHVIKDSVAAASALRSEVDSLSARVTQIGAEFSRVQETARAALERGATVELRLGAIESRLGPLGDLEDVRREIEKRFDALNALTHEVRANSDAVNRQQGRVAVRRSSLSMHVAEAMADLRVPKAIGPIKHVVVAAVFTVLALMSAFVLHSVWRTADLIGPSVVTAPVPSTAVPDLPSDTSATTSSEGSFDSATTVRSLTSTRQAASVDFETPATRRATEFVGTLLIRSTPNKADVHIDRERVGETPLVLRRLRAGSHAIWIDHEGYQRWTAGVNVRAEELTRVTVTLQAEPGR